MRTRLLKVAESKLAPALAPQSPKKGTVAETVSRPNGDSKPYGVQYYEKAREIWDRISATELPLIGLAADQAVAALKRGRRIYCQITGGHMHMAEFRRDRPGNPNYLQNWSRQVPEQEFEVIGKGDFLLFDCPRDYIRRARDRGAFTVGIRVPYFPNRTTPKGVHAMNELAVNPIFENIILPEECADILLTSGVPFTDGVLFIPEIPAVRVCPISPQGTFNFYWMLTAEISIRQNGGVREGSYDKAQQYIELIKARGLKICDSLEIIDSVAKAMVECVSLGGRYWNYPVRHSQESNFDETLRHDPGLWAIMVTENTERASGLVMSRLIYPSEIKEKGKPGDFVIMAAEASDTRECVEAAHACRSAGMKVIYIGPRTEGTKTRSMQNVADWHIDTFSPETGGALSVPGSSKICPTTGVLYALAQYMLNAQFIGHMIKAGLTPQVFMGLHLLGGAAYFETAQKVWQKRGY